MGNQFHWVLQLHNSRRLWIFNPFGYCGLYRRHTRRDEEDKLHDSKRVGTEINNSTDARAVMFKIKQKIWYQISKSNPKWFILFVFFVFFIINNNVTQFPASTSLGGGIVCEVQQVGPAWTRRFFTLLYDYLSFKTILTCWGFSFITMSSSHPPPPPLYSSLCLLFL